MTKALARIEQAHDKFVSIFQAVHKVDQETAKQYYEVEKFNFARQIQENNYLSNCDEISVAGTFLEVISNGLSFDKSSNQVYLIPRGNKLTYSYAAQGLIYLCTEAGSISHCTTPVLVYEGDDIEVRTVNGDLLINHCQAIPKKSNKILGGYCFIHLPNGVREPFWFDISEIQRLMKFSAKQNRGTANNLYTSGQDGQPDEGFLKTKIVKAALKNFRKKKTSQANYYDEDEQLIDVDPIHDEELQANEKQIIDTNLEF